ncbi:hypothetical protein [Deinococcus ruber]|uniref:Uncharacterized protein n=1 Tax=Deinococcus ruber TaxID=1848197 RepID=A0A918CMV7_9DEIO|nr:hypothetical protein [Deinococcus ruber]GGR31337.1 hypothetical protein GCM10008957_47530 [Deinococcus ruber]
MTDDQLFDALDGLYAYDSGSVDSGIHDELLRLQVVAYLADLPDLTRRETVGLFLWMQYLCPERVVQGYGPADAHEWLNWAAGQGLL